MGHCTWRPIPYYANPRHEVALEALGEFLADNHYSSWATSRIVGHVRRTGELAGAVALELLDPTDEATATEVYCEHLPEVPADSSAWDKESVILDAEMLAAGCHPRPSEMDKETAVFGPIGELPDLRDPHDWPALAPIVGGATDDDPMAFPPSRPARPLPDRLSPEGLAGAARALASFDRTS